MGRVQFGLFWIPEASQRSEKVIRGLSIFGPSWALGPATRNPRTQNPQEKEVHKKKSTTQKSTPPKSTTQKSAPPKSTTTKSPPMDFRCFMFRDGRVGLRPRLS